jgi:hypothetical protein
MIRDSDPDPESWPLSPKSHPPHHCSLVEYRNRCGESDAG